MRKLFIATLLLFAVPVIAQVTPARKAPPRTDAVKQYNSLLWEITGKGLKKPSYLFGTMHISDKLVFHLGDSFYNAMRSVDVVALESNPDNWQDDYSESVFFKLRRGNNYGGFRDYGTDRINERLYITSFAIDENTEAIKAALAIEPSLINGLLYRTYGSRLADFEEDTYLDMHIFQSGKKLGKKVAGVEDFTESEKLVLEAYRDMYRGKQKKKSYDFEGMYTNPKKMEEAYRKGDLDALDSLDALAVTSEAFQEKFLYKRNEIQARSIDSILKKSSLFAGVGAAHLPGKRGVISMLRDMGYTLRPVKMDDRNSAQKEAIDKIRFPTQFTPVNLPDGMVTVNIPGKKFYNFTEWDGIDVKQFADMANGAYYMVIRVKTNSQLLGWSEAKVHKKIDSLLYENIPGKILKKTPITRNGYKGWEVTNRIRRGDYQRYNIYVTPFEVIIFKMSGNGDYITKGTEAGQFFGSVKLKEFREAQWATFQPETGGFSADMPYKPFMQHDKSTGLNRIEYTAHDAQNSYIIMQRTLQSNAWVEEDSFDLKLMDESYAFSSTVDKKIAGRSFLQNGYRTQESTYRHKNGYTSKVRFIIRGPVCYAAAVMYPQENVNAGRFLESFRMQPFVYPETKLRTDTAFRFTVRSPFFEAAEPVTDLEKMALTLNTYRYYTGDDEDDETDTDDLLTGNKKIKIIGNDSLGENIVLVWQRPVPYQYIKDSVEYIRNVFTEADWTDKNKLWFRDSTLIRKLDTTYTQNNGYLCRELQLTDTGSSRLLRIKGLYRNGHFFRLGAVTDTSQQSSFINDFFSSFTPADTLKGESPFQPGGQQFFADFFSADSAVARKARKNRTSVIFSDKDVPALKDAIARINRKTRDYFEVKKQFIGELGPLKDSTITPWLRNLYGQVKDTADFQNAILNALLVQRTTASFTAYKDLLIQEPPVKSENGYTMDINRYMRQMMRVMTRYSQGNQLTLPYMGQYANGVSILYDTMQLTRVLFPDILQLLNVDDYKEDITDLLIQMVDSGYLKGSDYESWYTKINLDAKQTLKKQIAREDEESIERESRQNRPRNFFSDDEEDKEMDNGNNKLMNYAILLMPFYESKPGVPDFFAQLLKTRDRGLFYNTCVLMLRNKKTVPDSFFTRYAKLDEYRSRLYTDLHKLKMTDRIPAAYRTQEQIARSLINTSRSGYELPDSLVFLDKLPVTVKMKKGWVYFFKYKEAKDDNFWNITASGMQPEQTDSIDIENTDFITGETRKIQNDKPIAEQLSEMLNEMLNVTRTSAADFYETKRRGLARYYLSEMVKRDRFNE